MAQDQKSISIFNRIWIYSPAEAARLKNTNKGVSSTNIKLGTVVVDGGIAKPYTSIIRNVNQIHESDAIIITSGDMRKVHYTQHQIS